MLNKGKTPWSKSEPHNVTPECSFTIHKRTDRKGDLTKGSSCLRCRVNRPIEIGSWLIDLVRIEQTLLQFDDSLPKETFIEYDEVLMNLYRLLNIELSQLNIELNFNGTDLWLRGSLFDSKVRRKYNGNQWSPMNKPFFI